MQPLIKNLKLVPVVLLALLALTASVHVGCTNGPTDDATDEDNGALSGHYGYGGYGYGYGYRR